MSDTGHAAPASHRMRRASEWLLREVRTGPTWTYYAASGEADGRWTDADLTDATGTGSLRVSFHDGHLDASDAAHALAALTDPDLLLGIASLLNYCAPRAAAWEASGVPLTESSGDLGRAAAIADAILAGIEQ